MLKSRGFDVAVLRNSVARSDHSLFLGTGSLGQSLRISSLCSTLWFKLSLHPGQTFQRPRRENVDRSATNSHIPRRTLLSSYEFMVSFSSSPPLPPLSFNYFGISHLEEWSFFSLKSRLKIPNLGLIQLNVHKPLRSICEALVPQCLPFEKWE